MSTSNLPEQAQDQELAAFADSVLAGQPAPPTGPPPLAQTVELLARAVSPHPPPEHLRRQIRQRIAAEWARQPSQASESAGLQARHWLLRLFRPSKNQWAWAAVTAMAALAIMAGLLLPAQTEPLTGTVVGGASVVGVIILVLVGLAVAGWLIVRKK